LACSLEVCELSLGNESSHPHAASQYESFGPASIPEYLRHVLGVHFGRLALEMKWDGLACSLEACELSLGNANSLPHVASQNGPFGPASILEVQRNMLGEYPGRLSLEMKWVGLACSLEVCELSLGNENSHPHVAS